VITSLKLDDNGIRSLANIERLERLQSLFVSGSRLSEFWELDKLADMPHLMEVSFMNTPLSRKPMYRGTVIKKLPAVIMIDGKEVSSEERERIEIQKMDQKAPPMIHF